MNRGKTAMILHALVATLLAGILALNPAPAAASGATSVAGIGFLAGSGECVDPEGNGASFTILMTGDLEGCLYQFPETGKCLPDGVYIETGTEVFVGDYGGNAGSFRTTYKFIAQYADCPNLSGQIWGGCNHPIIAGSGTGRFSGVKGRLVFVDDVAAGNFHYRGLLRW